MLYVGIDQSYTSTGLVIINSDSELVDYIIIHSLKSDDIYQRAWNISEKIIEYLSDYDFEGIAVEGLAFGMIGNATRDLAGLQFLIVSKLKNILFKSVGIVSPTTLKKFATGNGRAKKPHMIEALPFMIREEFKDDGIKKTKGLSDVADAYWLAKTMLDKDNKN